MSVLTLAGNLDTSNQQLKRIVRLYDLAIAKAESKEETPNNIEALRKAVTNYLADRQALLDELSSTKSNDYTCYEIAYDLANIADAHHLLMRMTHSSYYQYESQTLLKEIPTTLIAMFGNDISEYLPPQTCALKQMGDNNDFAAESCHINFFAPKSSEESVVEDNNINSVRYGRSI